MGEGVLTSIWYGMTLTLALTLDNRVISLSTQRVLGEKKKTNLSERAGSQPRKGFSFFFFLPSLKSERTNSLSFQEKKKNPPISNFALQKTFLNWEKYQRTRISLIKISNNFLYVLNPIRLILSLCLSPFFNIIFIIWNPATAWPTPITTCLKI